MQLSGTSWSLDSLQTHLLIASFTLIQVADGSSDYWNKVRLNHVHRGAYHFDLYNYCTETKNVTRSAKKGFIACPIVSIWHAIVWHATCEYGTHLKFGHLTLLTWFYCSVPERNFKYFTMEANFCTTSINSLKAIHWIFCGYPCLYAAIKGKILMVMFIFEMR